MNTQTTTSPMRTFYFNTGVRFGVPINQRYDRNAKSVPLCEGQVWLNGTKQIPFDCEDVPEGCTFTFACDNPNLPGGYLVRRMHNTTMCSEYAYFILPYHCIDLRKPA